MLNAGRGYRSDFKSKAETTPLATVPAGINAGHAKAIYKKTKEIIDSVGFKNALRQEFKSGVVTADAHKDILNSLPNKFDDFGQH